MGFPIKLRVNIHEQTIDLSPSDYLKKKFDLHYVNINFENHMVMNIAMKSENETIKSDSIIHKVIEEFEGRTDNYKGMFVCYKGGGFCNDSYRFETSDYELSKEDFGQIIYDYIDSLKKVMDLSTETLNQINEAVAQFGYQLPKVNKQNQVISSAYSNLSMFGDNKKHLAPDPLPEESHSRCEKIDTEEVFLISSHNK